MEGEIRPAPTAEEIAQMPDGQRWLWKLGFGNQVGQDVTVDYQGEQVSTVAEDFPRFCGDHAVPILTMWEKLSPQDPKYERIKLGIQHMVGKYLGVQQVPSDQ